MLPDSKPWTCPEGWCRERESDRPSKPHFFQLIHDLSPVNAYPFEECLRGELKIYNNSIGHSVEERS
jgi:hypothetical protein